MSTNGLRPLGRWDKLALAVFVLVIVSFGALVELRSAFLSRRMGDVGVFLRTAWAARTGGDLYHITDDNRWHYSYPPLYAILMMPLADPPAGEDTTGYVPFAWSVAICYVFSVACLLAAVHLLASALEESAGESSFTLQTPGHQRWWALRLLPVVLCISPIGHTLMRGQVNLLILLSLCAAIALWMRRQSFGAGVWLSLAIAIKVLPAYLLAYPLWKRDRQALQGCALGLFVGLLLVPVAVFGPERAVTQYRHYGEAFFAPLLGMVDNSVRHKELLGVNGTDSMSVKNALHNWTYRDPLRRPETYHPVNRAIYVVLGLLATVTTLWRRTTAPWAAAGQVSGLVVLMVLFAPVNHMHYLVFCVPLLMVLLAHDWAERPGLRVSRATAIAIVLFGLTAVLPVLPGMGRARDLCVPIFGLAALWVAGQRLRSVERVAEAKQKPIPVRVAA